MNSEVFLKYYTKIEKLLKKSKMNYTCKKTKLYYECTARSKHNRMYACRGYMQTCKIQ